MGALKVVKKVVGNQPQQNTNKPKQASRLDNAVGAFKDWITSPGGIITVIGFLALMWLISKKQDKPAKA